MPTTISAADLDLLRRYDTPTICNVIEVFHCRPQNAGYMDSRIQCCYPKLPPMVGFACTGAYRSDAPPQAGNVYGSLDQQLENFAKLPGPAVIVFQDLDSPSAAATFGEIMCTTYKRFGAVGLVTSGAGRDLDQVEALSFPCFTNGTNCSHGYGHMPSVNVPVHVGGVMVAPGDLLHGDRNGVTTIPIDIASAVAHACADYVAAEAVILTYLKSSTVTVKGFVAARNECRAMLDAMAKRYSK